MTGTDRISHIPGQEEFFDAVRRHVCHVLGFDYGLIDVVRGHELINLTSFTAGSEDPEVEAHITVLADEHQQPLTVAQTLIAQRVKQGLKPWVGRAFYPQGAQEGYPYAIVPIMDDSSDAAGPIRGLLRVVSLDDTRKIEEKDLSTLKIFGQHLASRLPNTGVDRQAQASGATPALDYAAETVLVLLARRDIRRRFSRSFSGSFNVLESETADKAVDLLNEHHIDLIVLDSEVRGQSGQAFCRVLKESAIWKHIPVILVASDTNTAGKIEGLNAGAEDCLSENCPESELSARVRALLRLRKTERDLTVQGQLLEDYAERLEAELEKARQAKVKFSKDNQLLDQRNRELNESRREARLLTENMASLQRISDAIRKSFNINENVGEMLHLLADRLNLNCCFVVLPSEEEAQETIRSEYTSAEEYGLMARDEDLAILEIFKENFHRDQNLIVSDVSRDRLLDPFRKTVLSSYPLKSAFYIPVTYEDKLLGLLGGHKCESDTPWTTENENFLKSVADQVAIGVTNSRLYDRVQRQATIDGLTGLYNHRTGQEKLADQLRLAERYQRNLSVVMLDVDHFKTINDTYGHPSGDLVLKTIARLIRSNCRDVDIPVRYGGEEFLLVLPEVNQEGALVVAERIRQHIAREPIRLDGGEISVTASLGVAAYPEDAEGHQQLLDLADKSLYMSKRLGRNQVHTASNLLFSEFKQEKAIAKPPAPELRPIKPPQPEEITVESLPPAETKEDEFVPEVIEMVKALAGALYSKSEYNKTHHLETARFAELLAKVMGLSQQQVEQVRVASLLHDVGVLSIPEKIMNKPGLVTEEEMEMITQHPSLGAQLLRPIHALKEICDIVENHHECWDGTGYPSGLKGEEIPLASRIVAIVDSYHAMISDRPYRTAMTVEQAKQALKNGAGNQWDPFLVDIFIAVLDSLDKEASKPTPSSE